MLKNISLTALLCLSLMLCSCLSRSQSSSDDSWDKNRDGELSRSELAGGVLNSLDANRDLQLNVTEVAKGLDRINIMKEFDQDGDGEVSRLDFVFLFPDGGFLTGDVGSGKFFLWDDNSDGKLSLTELADGFLARYDNDHNQQLDRSEIELAIERLGVISALDADQNNKLSVLELSLAAQRVREP